MLSQRDLNFRQRRWIELLKDYDVNVFYHLGKTNIVADALSWMSMGSIAHVEDERKKLVNDVHHLAHLGVRLSDSNKGGILIDNSSVSFLVVYVRAKRDMDPTLVELKKLMVDRLSFFS